MSVKAELADWIRETLRPVMTAAVSAEASEHPHDAGGKLPPSGQIDPVTEAFLATPN